MIDKKYVTHQREPFFEIVNKLITLNSVVLDVGPGDGSFAKYCKRDDFFLYEGNPESAENLKYNYPNTFQGQLPKLPFKDAMFDVIHMSHVIEHLQPQEVYDTLKEFDRCCKPGGAIVISAPLLWSGFYDDLSHIRPYPPASYVKYLSNLGSNPTRTQISNIYTVEHMQYRYQLVDNKFRLRKKTGLIHKVFYKLGTFIRLSESIFTETGYTLVLRKSQNK
ncbi:class I SAM-dependent methyltransferase [Aequorivita sp. F47161]|uniref:Class I SAM-dependent methyltransferase n=1 Tax=Aequorivita vitellina TaxID=2874475 RepID=A0A9X1QW81_9FLAO|nr:class I SAM-dependent methyltransferase [Aequorivita vitellina]MCG2419875.1 class I SAM-dependent methyltransferase [Aequorivita vitellina]